MKKLITIFFLLVAILTNAATYYLSPTGNDTTGDGSIGSPWFTLNKAWTVIAAGDTVYLRGGTYLFPTSQELTGKNGTSGDLIKIWAYPEESPIITKSTGWTYTSLAGIYFDGDYFHWKNIEITGFTQLDSNRWHGFFVEGSNHNIFELLKCHGNALGMKIYGSCNNNLVLNSDFYNNYDPLTPVGGGDPYGNADGLEIQFTLTGSTNTVSGCRAWSNSDDGFDFWSADGMIIIDSCWSWYNGYREDGITTGGDGSGIKLGNTSADYSTLFLRTIKNNLVFQNRGIGIDQNGANAKMYIYNNTVYHNGSYGLFFNYYDLAHVFRNNVSFDNINNDWFGTHTNAVIDHNSYDVNWQPTGPVATTADFVSVDTTGVSGARQADGSLPDINFLRLAESSDLIDVGVDVGLTYNGTAPDLGAYEYGTATPPATSTLKIRVDAQGKAYVDSQGKPYTVIN